MPVTATQLKGCFTALTLALLKLETLQRRWLTLHKKKFFFFWNGNDFPSLGFTNLTITNLTMTKYIRLIASKLLTSQRQWKAASDLENIPLIYKQTKQWMNLNQIHLNSSAVPFARHGKWGHLCSSTAPRRELWQQEALSQLLGHKRYILLWSNGSWKINGDLRRKLWSKQDDFRCRRRRHSHCWCCSCGGTFFLFVAIALLASVALLSAARPVHKQLSCSKPQVDLRPALFHNSSGQRPRLRRPSLQVGICIFSASKVALV